MKGRQFIRRLRRAGVQIDTKRGKGGHIRLSYQGCSTVLPVHGDTDLAPEFLRTICKQLGIDWRKVI